MPGGTEWRKSGSSNNSVTVASSPALEFADDQFYLQRMKDILQPLPQHLNGSLSHQLHPVQLLEHVYIGSQRNADNVDVLRQYGITHVLNCAGLRRFDFTRSPYHKDVGIKGFLMFSAEDHEDYDMKRHFPDAIAFLNDVRRSRGRALVHCNLGVNRSGAVVAAYLMVTERRTLLDVVEYLRSKRALILSNRGFRRQLVTFAREQRLLDPVINTNGNVDGTTSRSVDKMTSSSARRSAVFVTSTPSVVISDMSTPTLGSSSSSSAASQVEVDCGQRYWTTRQSNLHLTPVYEQQTDGSSSSGGVLGGFLTLLAGNSAARRRPLRSTSYSNVSNCAAATGTSGGTGQDERRALSTSRPLRVYTRSSTDTELYRRGGLTSRVSVRQQLSDSHSHPPC